MKRSRIIYLLFSLATITSCSSNKLVKVSYNEVGGMRQVTLTQYKDLFETDENIISYLSLKGKDNCASCYGGTTSEIAQYASDNHFVIYHLVFDGSSETFIDDYNSLADLMAIKNAEYGIKKITDYKDGVPVIYSLPSLIWSNSGYIGFNVTKNFITTLKQNVITSK